MGSFFAILVEPSLLLQPCQLSAFPPKLLTEAVTVDDYDLVLLYLTFRFRIVYYFDIQPHVLISFIKCISTNPWVLLNVIMTSIIME